MKVSYLAVRLIAAVVVVCGMAGFAGQTVQAQTGPFVYVTNSSGNSVTVIDSSTNTVVTTISLCGDCGPQPAGLAVTPNGKFVYVANSGNGTVSVIATSTNTVFATINMCDCSSSPTGVAITPDGTRAYVTDISQSVVEVIDTNPNDGPGSPYNTVTATITLGGSPNGPIAITPDGSAAFYTFNGDGGFVGRIDTNPASASYNTQTTTLTVGNGPTGVAVTPNGAFIYVTNQTDGTVSVIPNTFPTFSPITTVAVGHGPVAVAITPDGQHAYVVNQGDATVSVISTASNTVTAVVGSGFCSSTNQIAITPNGTEAYVADAECTKADVISTASNTVTTTVSTGSGPFGVAIGPALGTQTKTLGGPGTTTTFTFNTDTYKITGVNNQGGEQMTVTVFPVPKSSFPALNGFSNETCIPYGDFTAAAGGVDTCVEFQATCVTASGATCNFIYQLATGYDLPPDLPAIGGPDFLVAHGQNCALTPASTVQSIFLSYTVALKDPTTRGGSKGPSCFVATYTPGAKPITSGGVTVNGYFIGFQFPIQNPPVVNPWEEFSEEGNFFPIPLIWQEFAADNTLIKNPRFFSFCSSSTPLAKCPANSVALQYVPIACSTHVATGAAIRANALFNFVFFNPFNNAFTVAALVPRGFDNTCQALQLVITGTGGVQSTQTALFHFQ